MWIYSYISITFLMSCKFVYNNESKEETHANIYHLIKNILPSHINTERLQNIKSVILKKPVIVNPNRNINIKDKNVELSGAIVILRNVDDSKLTKSNKENSIEINHFTWENPKKAEKQTYLPRLRKDNNKIIMAILDRETDTEVLRKGLSIEDSRDAKQPINQLSSNILRDKYGDACIKVAVRKCYKALLAVKVNVCKLRYKCKSGFKSYFIKKSKEGCIKEFDYRKGSDKNETSSFAKFRDAAFVDATREGYLDACIPYMVMNYEMLRSAIVHTNMTYADVDLSALRKDKSDKKCQRLSRAKCYRACKFAVKESCAKYGCSRRKNREFSKTCKEECTRAYRVRTSSDSSESDSD